MTSMENQALLKRVLEERLDNAGVGNEMIVSLMRQEASSLRRHATEQEVQFPTKSRLLALHFLYGVSPKDSEMLTCYTSAVQLFDLVSPHVLGTQASPTSAVALAAAALSVSVKMLSIGPKYELDYLSAAIDRNLGLPGISGSDIARNEQLLLQGCNISAPTVSTWGSLFSSRLDNILKGSLTDGGLLKRLQAAYDQVLTFAIDGVRVSQASSPYNIAMGSFCLAMVVAGLVPSSQLINLGIPLLAAPEANQSMIEEKLTWLISSLGALGHASHVPMAAIFAAAEVALYSTPESMQFVSTILAIKIQVPTQTPPHMKWNIDKDSQGSYAACSTRL